MKCPLCNSDQTRLSWLREFTVVYWCAACHADFEINRHRTRTTLSPKSFEDINGHDAPPG